MLFLKNESRLMALIGIGLALTTSLITNNFVMSKNFT